MLVKNLVSVWLSNYYGGARVSPQTCAESKVLTITSLSKWICACSHFSVTRKLFVMVKLLEDVTTQCFAAFDTNVNGNYLYVRVCGERWIDSFQHAAQFPHSDTGGWLRNIVFHCFQKSGFYNKAPKVSVFWLSNYLIWSQFVVQLAKEWRLPNVVGIVTFNSLMLTSS